MAEIDGPLAAPTLEAGIVLSARMRADATPLLAELIDVADAVVIEFGAAHWEAAINARWQFGRTRHAAALNFGDCIAYAAASVAGQPLLAKGEDFRRTDIDLARDSRAQDPWSCPTRRRSGSGGDDLEAVGLW